LIDSTKSLYLKDCSRSTRPSMLIPKAPLPHNWVTQRLHGIAEPRTRWLDGEGKFHGSSRRRASLHRR
jgi:hypothetical protein